MASIFSLGGPQYDVDDVKIAVNNGDGTFGTLVDVPSCDLFVTGLRMKSAEMRGDGGIRALASQIEAAEVQVRFGSFPFNVYQILFGVTADSSGTTPNVSMSLKLGLGKVNPYFGLAARTIGGEDVTTGTIIFVPYVKIMQTVSVRLEYNTFTMPEVNGLAVADPVLTTTAGNPMIWQIKGYETLPAITMPLPL